MKNLNLATKITVSRILLIPFFIAFILYGKWTLAIIIFAVASLTDGIDGYIARKTKKRTELGTILDPIADKVLIISAFICLSVSKALPPYMKPPTYVPIIVISRDAIIMLGSLLIFLMKSRIEVKPTMISKITTAFQMITVLTVLMRFSLAPLIWNIMIVFTMWSGFDYIIKGSRLLNEK